MKDPAVEYLEETLGRKLPAAAYHPNFTQQEIDRAKRATDIVNECLSDIRTGDLMCSSNQAWLAIRLSDGGCDMTVYDNKQAAVRHQLHEQQCAYISLKNLMGGANVREMMRYLRFNQMAYDQGMRLPDPDAENGGPDLIPTAGAIDAISGHKRVTLP